MASYLQKRLYESFMSRDSYRALNSDKITAARTENRWHHHQRSSTSAPSACFSTSTEGNAKAGQNLILQTERRMSKERWTWPVRTLSSWTTIQQDGRNQML